MYGLNCHNDYAFAAFLLVQNDSGMSGRETDSQIL